MAKRNIRRYAGVVLMAAGILFAASALVSGPRAFGGRGTAVVALCMAGALLAAGGLALFVQKNC